MNKKLFLLTWVTSTLSFWGLIYSPEPPLKRLTYLAFFFMTSAGIMVSEYSLGRRKVQDKV